MESNSSILLEKIRGGVNDEANSFSYSCHMSYASTKRVIWHTDGEVKKASDAS